MDPSAQSKFIFNNQISKNNRLNFFLELLVNKKQADIYELA